MEHLFLALIREMQMLCIKAFIILTSLAVLLTLGVVVARALGYDL